MKGIACCGDCVYYDWKKHKCKRCNSIETDPRKPFYDDCPLPDVVIKKEPEARLLTVDEIQNLKSGTPLIVEQLVISAPSYLTARVWGVADGRDELGAPLIHSFVGTFHTKTIDKIPYRAMARNNKDTELYRFWTATPTHEQSKAVEWE